MKGMIVFVILLAVLGTTLRVMAALRYRSLKTGDLTKAEKAKSRPIAVGLEISSILIGIAAAVMAVLYFRSVALTAFGVE